MVNDIAIIRAWVRSAKRTAGISGKQLTAVLDDINAGILSQGIQAGGTVVISTTDGGGSVGFALPAGHTPLELAQLNEEAIQWCNQYPDPNNPPLIGRRIKRLRVSMWKAKP